MAAKKKPNKASIAKKRAIAARKGWETRRKQALEEERKRKAKLAARRKREKEKRELANREKAKRESRNRKRREEYARKKTEVAELPRRKKKIVVTREKREQRQTIEEIRREAFEEGRKKGKEERLLRDIQTSWVSGAPPELRKHDGTVAVRPSDLRALDNSYELHLRLKKFELLGEARLNREARIMANMYGVTLREVYTLLMSP